MVSDWWMRNKKNKKYLKKISAVSEGLDLENPSKTTVGEMEVKLPTCFLYEGPETTKRFDAREHLAWEITLL